MNVSRNTPVPSHWSTKTVIQFTNTGWVKTFRDPQLTSLVQEAIENNFDVQAAVARVEAALAVSRIEGSARLPQLNFGTNSGRFEGDHNDNNFFEALFNLSWELDVWGRIRANQRAVVEEASAASFDLDAARLSIAARTAQAWFDLVEAENQVKVAENSLHDRRKITELVRGRFERGLSQGLELRLTLTDLANIEAQLAVARDRLQVTQRNLEILLGHYPAGKAQSMVNLPAIPAILPAGLPVQLLQRRPDLRAAFARLEASDARLASAYAALLPRFSLTGQGGMRSSDFDLLLNPSSALWNIAGGLTQPLLTGGRLRNDIKLKQANVSEQWANYRQTSLTAFQEVEQALASEQNLRAQEEALQEAVRQAEANKQAVIYAYQNGLTDILTLLDNYRSTFATQSTHLSTKRQLLSNRINLYLALGGNY